MPQERLLSRAIESDKYTTRDSWSAHVDQWLEAWAANHARITGGMSDAALRCGKTHQPS